MLSLSNVFEPMLSGFRQSPRSGSSAHSIIERARRTARSGLKRNNGEVAGSGQNVAQSEDFNANGLNRLFGSAGLAALYGQEQAQVEEEVDVDEVAEIRDFSPAQDELVIYFDASTPKTFMVETVDAAGGDLLVMLDGHLVARVLDGAGTITAADVKLVEI